jgi:hypothetical protein
MMKIPVMVERMPIRTMIWKLMMMTRMEMKKKARRKWCLDDEPRVARGKLVRSWEENKASEDEHEVQAGTIHMIKSHGTVAFWQEQPGIR